MLEYHNKIYKFGLLHFFIHITVSTQNATGNQSYRGSKEARRASEKISEMIDLYAHYM